VGGRAGAVARREGGCRGHLGTHVALPVVPLWDDQVDGPAALPAELRPEPLDEGRLRGDRKRAWVGRGQRRWGWGGCGDPFATPAGVRRGSRRARTFVFICSLPGGGSDEPTARACRASARPRAPSRVPTPGRLSRRPPIPHEGSNETCALVGSRTALTARLSRDSDEHDAIAGFEEGKAGWFRRGFGCVEPPASWAMACREAPRRECRHRPLRHRPSECVRRRGGARLICPRGVFRGRDRPVGTGSQALRKHSRRHDRFSRYRCKCGTGEIVPPGATLEGPTRGHQSLFSRQGRALKGKRQTISRGLPKKRPNMEVFAPPPCHSRGQGVRSKLTAPLYDEAETRENSPDTQVISML